MYFQSRNINFDVTQRPGFRLKKDFHIFPLKMISPFNLDLKRRMQSMNENH